MENVIPSFFNDDSKGYDEIFVDFWLSWTIRCVNIISSDKSYLKVKEYSRKILSYCISKRQDVNFLNNKNINKIRCWKQYSTDNGKIDLWFELEIENKKYALIFENKVNAKISKGQLEKYKKYIDNYYKNKDYEVIYIFLRANDEYIENDEKICKKNGFVPILYSELQEATEAEKDGDWVMTENDLFDEFWFKW